MCFWIGASGTLTAMGTPAAQIFCSTAPVDQLNLGSSRSGTMPSCHALTGCTAAPDDSLIDRLSNGRASSVVAGDGWHNNHHAFQESAAHGLEWWQVDASYYLVAALEAVGLAWDVKRPTEQQKARLRLPAA